MRNKLFSKMAGNIADVVGGKLIVFAIDAGGYKFLNPLSEELGKNGVECLNYVWRQGDYFVEGDIGKTAKERGYRPIIGVVPDYDSENPHIEECSTIYDETKEFGSEWALILDDDIHDGHSIVGGIFHAIENRELYGFKKLIVGVEVDMLGVAHFTTNGQCNTGPEGLKQLMRKLGPKKYAELGGDRVLSPILEPRYGGTASVPFHSSWETLERLGALIREERVDSFVRGRC